jgi:hypothetical protein
MLARRRGGFVADVVDRHFKIILYASPLRDLALASMTAIRQCFMSLLDLIGDDETSWSPFGPSRIECPAVSQPWPWIRFSGSPPALRAD